LNFYNSNGKLESKYISKYDDKNNLIEEVKYNQNGEIIETKSFNYKYDQKDNWIEKIEYKNAIPQILKEREIEYY